MTEHVASETWNPRLDLPLMLNAASSPLPETLPPWPTTRIARMRANEPVAGEFARVLLVEDNAITQLVTMQQLRELDCVARTASSGVAALEAMRAEQFDLILLDCRMPDISGYETARAIRHLEKKSRRPRAPIVAITGDDDVQCVDKCIAAGMDGHVGKPASLFVLRDILDRYVR